MPEEIKVLSMNGAESRHGGKLMIPATTVRSQDDSHVTMLFSFAGFASLLFSDVLVEPSVLCTHVVYNLLEYVMDTH